MIRAGPRLDAGGEHAAAEGRPGGVERRCRLVVGALMALAAGATWVATRHGPGLSPDSVTYLSLARNLARGRGFVDFTGRPDTTFPPGLPALLAAGIRLGASPLDAARFVNGLSFAAIVLLSWKLLRRHTASTRVAMVATVFVASSPAVLNVADEVWSETLFCALVLGFFLLLEDALHDDAGHRPVIAAGLAAGLAFTVRYAATSLGIVGVLLLLALPASTALRSRVRRATIFLAGAAVLPAIWMVRNATSTNPYLTGPRAATSATLLTLVRLFVKGSAELFVPQAAVIPWILVTAPLAVTALLGLRIMLRTGRAGSTPDLQEPPRPSLVVLSAFLFVYTTFLLVAGKFTGASVDSRTAMPIAVPTMIVVACAFEARTRSVTAGDTADRPRVLGGRLARVAIAVTLAAAAFYAVWFTQVALADGSAARGYARATTSRSPLARAVRDLPPGAIVVSDEPWALYAATGRQPILPIPGPVEPAASLVPPGVEALASASCVRPVYVASTATRHGVSARARFPLRLAPAERLRDGALAQVVAPAHCGARIAADGLTPARRRVAAPRGAP